MAWHCEEYFDTGWEELVLSVLVGFKECEEGEEALKMYIYVGL